MSDLRPVGIPVNFDGVERNFLFTLNVIEELEEYFQKPVFDILKDVVNPDNRKTIRKVTQVLVNDDIERYNLTHTDKQEKITERYVGAFLTSDLSGGNIIGMMGKIMEAYQISVPKGDEENPNQESGQQKN